jgi:hypothetical protein
LGRLGVSVSFRSRHADSPGPPGRVYLPPVTPVQWLQAQELPVIQAKGLELEHFHPWVSTARTHGEGLREVEDWPLRPPGAVPATAPRSHGPALPRGLHSARLRYKEQRAQKPAAFSLSLARSPGQAHSAAVSGGWCFWGLPWESPGQTEVALSVLSRGGPQAITLGGSGGPGCWGFWWPLRKSAFPSGPWAPRGRASTCPRRRPPACLA